jgi:hypothetical protein
MTIKKKETNVSFSVPGKPVTLEVDPDVNLLYEGAVKQLR